MAHHKSAIKRIRTNERDRQRNRHYKTLLKSSLKKVRSAESKEQAEALYRQTESILDKLVNKRIIHKNKAANQKSKLAVFVNQL